MQRPAGWVLFAGGLLVAYRQVSGATLEFWPCVLAVTLVAGGLWLAGGSGGVYGGDDCGDGDGDGD